MVSLVIVSHSKKLASGVLELAAQMSQGKVKMTMAAGIDDPENPIGTDPIAVMTAIEEVYSPDGVLVLVDMGSAILSTDMALELLDEEIAGAVHVCAAPLIEGAMAACVSAAAGASLEQVLSETHSAIIAKYEALDQSRYLPFSEGAEPETEPDIAEGDYSFSWEIKNPHGIHARPASAIVSVACQYQAEMWLSKDDKQVSAKSINNVTLLGAKQKDTITCITQGEDAARALEAFIELAKNNFGDDLSIEAEPVLSPEQTIAENIQPEMDEDGSLQGIGVSEGMAIAPARRFCLSVPQCVDRLFTSVNSESERLEAAIGKAVTELESLIGIVEQKASETEADIFRAHQQLLSDPELKESVEEAISQKRIIAEQAWTEEIEVMTKAYRELPDTYLAERANDICDIGNRVLHLLVGQSRERFVLSEPAILFASEVYPSDTALFDPERVKGLCLEKGEATSHSAIIARSLGIPVVAGLSGITECCQEGSSVLLDGVSGKVWLNPDDGVMKQYQEG